MRVYFLAEKPCALHIGGAYLGMIDGFERTVSLDPEDSLLVEISPLDGFLPVRFCFDGKFLLSPPPQIRLYYTDGAVAVYACSFLRADQSLRVLWQKRFGAARLTLLLQGKLLLDLQSESLFRLLPLPDALETCEASEHPDGFLLKSETAFALVGREGELLVLSEGTVLPSEEGLRAEVPFHDSMGHSAICQWNAGSLVSCSIRARSEPTQATLALALFESALIGADCAPFLSPELSEKATDLKAFLKDFRSVVLTSETDRVGLVYERCERIFDVRYFRVETEEGKISNIKPES